MDLSRIYNSQKCQFFASTFGTEESLLLGVFAVENYVYLRVVVMPSEHYRTNLTNIICCCSVKSLLA